MTTKAKPKRADNAAKLKISLENGGYQIIDALKGWSIMGLLMKHRIPVGAVKKIEFVEPE